MSNCGPQSPLQWFRTKRKSVPNQDIKPKVTSESLSNSFHNNSGDSITQRRQFYHLQESDEELLSSPINQNLLQPKGNYSANRAVNSSFSPQSFGDFQANKMSSNIFDNLVIDNSSQQQHKNNYSNSTNTLATTAFPPNKNLTGEARIVAPNVSKLSPASAVEVRLQSTNETVSVLCAVDVLKMRSAFFLDVLTEQERKNQQKAFNQTHGNAMLMSSNSNSAPSTFSTVYNGHNNGVHVSMSTNNTTTNNNNGIMWREAIIISESSPFEAAAFLESLHEGRMIFRNEWNLCWAKLR